MILVKTVKNVIKLLAANWVVLLIGAIIALIGYLIYAYNTNEEFRDKVNNAFTAIKEFVVPIIDGIGQALSYLWNEILVPVGLFIGEVFVKIWEGLSTACSFFWNEVLIPIGDAFKWLWNEVLVPIGTFLGDTFTKAWEFLTEKD